MNNVFIHRYRLHVHVIRNRSRLWLYAFKNAFSVPFFKGAFGARDAMTLCVVISAILPNTGTVWKQGYYRGTRSNNMGLHGTIMPGLYIACRWRPLYQRFFTCKLNVVSVWLYHRIIPNQLHRSHLGGRATDYLLPFHRLEENQPGLLATHEAVLKRCFCWVRA